MNILPLPVSNLIEELSKLPGIGPKTAQRLTFYLIKQKDNDLEHLGETVRSLKKNLTFCKECHIISDKEMCAICENETRDQTLLCIVADALDVVALEKTGIYKERGMYFKKWCNSEV